MRPVTDPLVSGWASAGSAPADVPAAVRRLQRGFADALARVGTGERAYRFAGRPVRLRVAGAEFAERTHRAFSHLRDDARPRARDGGLRVDLWDESATGVPFDVGSLQLGREWVACGGVLAASADGRHVAFRYGDSVTLLDRHREHMVGFRRRGSELSGGEYSKPLQLMLSIWYHDRGVQLLHAGLIACSGAGVLLPGASGTGKSTTAIAAAVHGLEFLADDFVGVERLGGDFAGHSIFATACVAQENLHRFPALRPFAVHEQSATDEKPIIFLSELLPSRVRQTVPVRAIALIRVGGARTSFTRARPAEALREFAASSLHVVVPRPGRAALELLSDLVDRVPAYWLSPGRELADLPQAVEAMVTGGPAGA